MELTGQVTISCKKTGYYAEIDFKSKPMFGGEYNTLSGKICKWDKVLYFISGKWDGKMMIEATETSNSSVLFQPTKETRSRRLVKQKPVYDQMESRESTKLWKKVSDAILKDDQELATDEKAVLEGDQRASAKKRQETGEDFTPRFFEKNHEGIWTYKYFNTTPWNPEVESEEYEVEGVIQSRKK